jgi:hypothetical protein
MVDDRLIEAVAEQVRRPIPLTARVEDGVLAQLRDERRRERRGPRRSPLVGLAIAAGLAALFAAGVLVGRHHPASPTVSVSPRPAAVAVVDTVDFVLRTSADSAVVLVGDFNDWDPAATPLRQIAVGVWAATVPLRPGRYRYTFIADGSRWLRDP